MVYHDKAFPFAVHGYGGTPASGAEACDWGVLPRAMGAPSIIAGDGEVRAWCAIERQRGVGIGVVNWGAKDPDGILANSWVIRRGEVQDTTSFDKDFG